MQTFVPLADFHLSASTLDLARLGKQIIEARQIGLACDDPDYGWQNHPAVAMWRGHVGGLLTYAAAMNGEWTARRGKPHGAWINMEMDHLWCEHGSALPAWVGTEAVHLSHRSNLLRKAPDHYRQHWPTDPDSLPYEWPTAQP